jgi:hypothetical protein
MVRYLIVLMIAYSMSKALHAQELSKDLVFEERVFNFGTINEKNGKISHTFYFRNTGKKPVTISDVNTGCSCVGNVLRKGPVNPGEKSSLIITFDPSYKSGFVSKEIIIFSEKGTQYNHVWVEGNVIAGEHPVEEEYPYNFGNSLYLRFKVLAFGYLRAGNSRKMELPFANAGSIAMDLKFIPRNNKDGLYFTNPGKVAPNSKGTVSFNYMMPFGKQDDVIIYLDVYVNDKKLPDPLQIKVLNDNKLGKS